MQRGVLATSRPNWGIVCGIMEDNAQYFAPHHLAFHGFAESEQAKSWWAK
jgi:hypothetical protein